ncbi:hypothetical protein SAMN04487944_1182 [Gracilibacillus ureilyticus]|uniref:Peptide zinc metalloprotease protein n=1 Tax=Gracilibacillus ureilyticus TaxID=531814 RepID=A0A1H9UJW7_9BACI|nr:peptidase [Gracilibacillus ureilyticus]SES09725.1 hypothetical protein SAMN04487944_1182 [Gracilibacillus ureilyticus]
MISKNSHITLNPLTFRKDKKNYIVEDNISGEFYEMPKICIDAIELINDQVPLDEIEGILKERYPEEEVDILAFAEQLIDLELVKEIDGKEMKQQQQKANSTPTGFMWIPPQVGRFFFHRGSIIILALIIFINILYMIIQPEFFPNYQDIFIFDSLMISVLLYMFLSLLHILIHEFGHILAMRAHNLPTKLGIGHRLYILIVFETDMSPAWKLQPKERNLLYLGGIYFDQWIVAIVLTLRFFVPMEGTIVDSILAVVVLDIFIKTIYQCCFYMKTDLYYLFENITGCYNIMENSQQLIRKWLPFVKENPKTEIFQDEKVYIRLYAVFYLIGVSITLALLFIYILPQFIYLFSRLLPALISPSGSPYFWDAVIFLGQMIIIAGLLLYTWIKTKE